MKKIALTLIAFGFIACAMAQTLAVNSPTKKSLLPEKAAFAWTATTVDFGRIKVGVPVSHEFKFTNTGEGTLVISSVQASCGCTVTAYTKDPIAPGQEGFVKATYNAARVGVFSKTVTVNANTDDELVQLTIKGEVIE